MSLTAQISSLLNWVTEVSMPQKKVSPGIVPNVQHHHSVPTCVSHIVRIAGLSGAVAVALGAYGSHKIREDHTLDVRRKNAFEAGSRYHLIHTLAILATPKARYPYVTSAFFLGGIIAFCGPCYHYGITGQESLRSFAPIGGIMFIVGWLTFMF